LYTQRKQINFSRNTLLEPVTELKVLKGSPTETDIIRVKKRRVCPGCGMTIEEGGEMFRSLTMPGKFVCLTCAIKEREEIKRRRKM